MKSDSPRMRVTKRLLTLTAVAGVVAWTSTAWAANVLINPNLDTIVPPTPGCTQPDGLQCQIGPYPASWNVDAVKTVSGQFYDGGDSEPWCNVSPPSDANGYGFFYKPFQGTAGAIPDLINVFLNQDNPTTPGTKFTLSGYAAGEANFCAFFSTNNPLPQALFVIEFVDNGGNVIASNGFDLVAAGLPNGGPGSMSTFQYTTPQVIAPAGTVVVRAGAMLVNGYNTTVNPQNFFVDSLDLESVAPPGSPVITNQPAQVTVAPGGTAHFSVGVSNLTGVTYQWQRYGTNLANGGNISGATAASLTVANAAAADATHYRVLVGNSSGNAYSNDGTLALVNAAFYPVVLITGKIGDTYEVDYSTAVAPTTWIPFSTNKLASSPTYVLDTGSPGSNTRFYRALFLH